MPAAPPPDVARPRVLAVLHEATLTGAPMNLLHLLRWAKRERDVDIHTLVLRDGALRHRFAEVGPVTVVDRWAVPALLGTVQTGLQHLGSRRAWRPVAALRMVPQLRGLGRVDVAYCNSLTSVSVLQHLPAPGAVLAHVHELNVAYRVWRSTHDLELFRTRPDRWVAASGAVRDFLVDEVHLPDDRVRVHHEFVDAAGIAARHISRREVAAARREYRVPADAAVVVGAGTVDWRKGADLFVQLACEVRRRRREPVHFVWVGGDLRSPDWERVRSDRDRAGADHVHFVGVRDDPLPWFAMADVFALTSREDPFPLVGLEAAALGVPLVTYRNGGMPELLEAAGPAAAAGVVDHLDVAALAARTIDLIDSEALRRAAGDALRARVLGHHDVAVAAPRLWGEVEALMGRGSVGAPGRPATEAVADPPTRVGSLGRQPSTGS